MFYDGQPILKDTPDDVYLASKYKSYNSKLELLGVRHADLSSMIKRLEADILNPRNSRLRTTNPSDPWHTAFASMFFKAWSNVSPAVDVQKRLRQLAIIPLQDRQQWAGAPCQSGGGRLKNIYLSHANGVAIPNSIGLSLLDTYASSNTTRKAFYMALGVEECSNELVVNKIKQIHSLAQPPSDIPSHLEYLFRANEDPLDIRRQVWIKVNGGHVKRHQDTYFPSEEEHGLQPLLAGIESSEWKHIALFVDESLVRLKLGLVNNQQITWRAWLQQVTGAQYRPSFLQRYTVTSPLTLSSALKVVHKHKPVAFLDALRAHWQYYKDHAHEIEAELRGMQVQRISLAGATLQYQALQDTYLPTANIVDRALRLGISPYNLPILQLPGFRTFQDKLNNAEYRKWRFLEEFGVHHEPDLAFYKRALKETKLAAPNPGFEPLKVIYSSIANLATASDHHDIWYVESSLFLSTDS
jgi:hypothetical protein